MKELQWVASRCRFAYSGGQLLVVDLFGSAVILSFISKEALKNTMVYNKNCLYVVYAEYG